MRRNSDALPCRAACLVNEEDVHRREPPQQRECEVHRTHPCEDDLQPPCTPPALKMNAQMAMHWHGPGMSSRRLS